MNQKANVTKELNAQHRKILEGLLKLPENRECADCKSKGPRWASVNLGIFVCMQCSGIHRSLGVHISKVRSATLDTWLPEQVAFIQSMGNEKANSYWEAELPPNYDRVGIENFIRAKYEEKRWVSKDGKPKSPSRELEEQASVQWQRSVNRTGHGYASNSDNISEERKNYQEPSTKNSIPTARISVPVPPRGPEPVAPATKPQQPVQKSETAVSPAESVNYVAEAASPPKVDFATDLFNMLSVDDPTESDSGAASADDNAWAGFQSATAETSITEKKNTAKPVENMIQSASGIEDLFQDSPSISLPSVPETPQKDVKNDIMSLFEKSNLVSPFAIHQQQLAMLAQQQSLLMATAAKSAAGGMPKFPGNMQQPGSNGTSVNLQSNMVPPFAIHQQQLAMLAQQQSLLIAAAAKSAGGMPQPASNGANVSSQNWPNVGNQIPGMMMSLAGNNYLEKYMQMGNMEATHPLGNSVPFQTSSTYSTGQNVSGNGVAPSGATRPQSASPVSSASSTRTGKDYDFSSLTQGMFSKP